MVTYRRQAILCDPKVQTTLRNAIETVHEKRPFTIEAWVLLPDHLYCIWTLPVGDADYATRWGMINVTVQRRAVFRASVATVCWATCADQGLILTSLGPIARSATSVSKAACARSQ